MQYPRVKLGNVCIEKRERILSTQISLEQYVTTDNMLKNCQGICCAESMPPYEVGLVQYSKGDVLLSNIRPYLKKSWLADRDGGCSNDVIVFSPSTSKLSSYYLSKVLSQDSFFDYVMQNVSGTKMPRGKREWIKQFEFPLPPLPVQQEIVAKLEKELAKVDEMADAFKRMAELADEEFKAILSETFEHVEGKRVKFEDICNTVSSRGHQILQSEVNKTGKYPVISQSENLMEGYSDFDNPITEVPIVLFGDHTCCVKKIERPFVVGADGTKLLYSSFHTIDFLYYFLLWCSPKLIDGKYRRHFSDLSKIEIPLVDTSTQERIVSKLESAKYKSVKIDSESKHGLSLCSELRKSILQEAFA